MAHHEEPQISAHLLASIPHGTYLETFHPDRDPIFWNLIANRRPFENGYYAVPEEPASGWSSTGTTSTRYRSKWSETPESPWSARRRRTRSAIVPHKSADAAARRSCRRTHWPREPRHPAMSTRCSRCGIDFMPATARHRVPGCDPEGHRQQLDRRVVVRRSRARGGAGDQRRRVRGRADHARRDPVAPTASARRARRGPRTTTPGSPTGSGSDRTACSRPRRVRARGDAAHARVRHDARAAGRDRRRDAQVGRAEPAGVDARPDHHRGRARLAAGWPIRCTCSTAAWSPTPAARS